VIALELLALEPLALAVGALLPRHSVVLPTAGGVVTLLGVELQRSLNGAVAGALGAAAWAAQQPLDKRLFRSAYDDVELLGKLVTRDSSAWPLAGLVLHLQNGALFGAVYAQARPLLPGPPVLWGLVAAMGEHVGLWPLVQLTDQRHPARRELPRLGGNRRAFVQAAWRHLVFGIVLAEFERRLNADDRYEPLEVPVSSNGHGNIERAAVGAA
jgi:hypothetical protein